MYSFDFPNMFSINKSNLLSDKEATLSNLKLLLGAEKRSLFGDPYFGTALKKFLYEQNDRILIDIVVDEIYTSMLTFLPQVRVERRGITLSIDGSNTTPDGRPLPEAKDGKHLYINVKCTYVLDNSAISYTINLLADGE